MKGQVTDSISENLTDSDLESDLYNFIRKILVEWSKPREFTNVVIVGKLL